MMRLPLFSVSMGWVIQNLRNALAAWNEKVGEIWELLTESPKTFREGAVWDIIEKVDDVMTGIGLSLLVLFFLGGILRHYTSLHELERFETSAKLFLRFGIAKVLVTYGLDLMMAFFDIGRGILLKIGDVAGISASNGFSLPEAVEKAVEGATFWESIPIWFVTLLGSTFIWALSVLLILTVYGRFFRLYLYLAVSPIPLAAFAGEGSAGITVSFLKSFALVCLEGVLILLSCVIYSAFLTTSPTVDGGTDPVNMLWQYLGGCIFNMLVLTGTVRASDRVIREMAG